MSPSLEPMQAGESAYEMKFPLHPSLAEEVRAWARMNLLPDPNGAGEYGDTYDIASLYLDTPGLDVFHGNRAGGRSKYRVRRYDGSQTVFLERKQKREAKVKKWRSAVDLNELDYLMPGESSREWAGEWYRRRVLARSLRPVCEIVYRRTARIAACAQGTIRLTLDDSVVAAPQSRLHFGAVPRVELADVPVILELKYKTQVPTIFKQLIQDFRLQPLPFSKYKLAVAQLRVGTGAAPAPLLLHHCEQLACPTS